MYKKALGMFLMGALFFFCSCVDDTYDLANKEIKTDMQIKGNKLSLPLGSLRPILLDSILVDSILDSIPMISVNEETRSYSLLLNDSLKTGIDKENLGALKDVSKLSANIDPFSIPIAEISFDPAPYSLRKELEFGEVNLSDITLNTINKEIALEFKELTLDPIEINVKPEERIKFDIPTVELKPIEIEGISQTETFNIDDIDLEEGTTIDIATQTIELEVPEFEMPTITPPSFSANYDVSLSAPAIDKAINGFSMLGKVPYDITIPGVNINDTDDHEVMIRFGYELPQGIEEIKDLTKIVFEKESSKVSFKLTNPKILRSQTGLKRTINFTIVFPENYKLAIDDEADKSKCQYQWDPSTPYKLSASITPGNEEITEISFFLTEIGLDFNPEQPKININDKAVCTLNYVVNGDVFIEGETSISEISNGLKYNLGLDVAFAMAEAWGSTHPVSTKNAINQELDFSFELNNLDYIKSIDKIVLNPQESKLCFSMAIDNGFGAFDIDENSKIVLSLPKEFIFAKDGMVLPKDPTTNESLVVYKENDNEFEISSLKVFESNQSWELPISGVKFGDDNSSVIDGTFKFNKKAVVKAVTGTEETLTIGGVDNIDLVAQTDILFQDHEITLSASPITLVVTDVEGSTNAIDLEFKNKTFEFDFDMEGDLENIASINYVKFDTNKPITLTSSVQGFDDIDFAEGSRIALRFPEDFIFDKDKSSLEYDEELKAFVITDFSELANGTWTFALEEVKIDPQNAEDGFDIEAEVTMEAINDKGIPNTLYVGFSDKFSLDKMREQGLFGEKELKVVLNDSEIIIEDVEVTSKEIDVNFDKLEITYPINLENLNYITRIGSVDLKETSNLLNFHSEIKGEDGKKKELGRFDLSDKSAIYLNFPSEFKLDMGHALPDGAEFIDSSKIKITSLNALDSKDWSLRVKRIAINSETPDHKLNNEYTINVIGCNADGEGEVTIDAINDLTLDEIQTLGGECVMDISVEGQFEIADVEVSIENIGVDFKEQEFIAPIPTIENLELIKEIKYISFEEGKNIINLNISLDGSLGDFDLVDSKVKLSLPTSFELDVDNCNFSEFNGLVEYNDAEKAIYIKSIQSIINNTIQLAIEKIEINEVIVENKFDWEVKFAVTAITDSNEPGKIYVGSKNNDLRFTEVSPIMGDKVINILVEEAKLSIDKAVIVSNGVTEEIVEKVDIPLKESITEAIEQVHTIGFANPVPMTLNISTEGLETLEDTVYILADITFPPVFDITSNNKNITSTEQGLHLDIAHSFKDSKDIQLELLVNSLDFTTLEGGCLALVPDDNGNRVLEYNGSAAINGSVSIADATVSSDLLEGISMDLSFDMGKVVLKDFTGLYCGEIDAITQSFELGIENGFDELKENGITLTNTKPELMISIYNPIGVPVDVDFSIVGKNKDGNEILTSKISPEETLHIKPAKFDERGELVADTTRWLFTSDEKTEVPEGYEPIVIENLASLLDELPYSIDFSLKPTIVTKDVLHHVDLTKLELGGSYAVSVPFDLQFEKSIPLDFGEEINNILHSGDNVLALANPQLALSIHNPIAYELAFGLSIIGKDANGQPIETFTIDFMDNPLVLKAGVYSDADTITPTATRWLFAVSEDIKKEGYETKAAPALGTLLENIPHDIDIALNAHFNTDLTAKIDYNKDLDLLCEYGVMIPLQFDDLKLSYTDTISEISLNLQESLDEMGVSISNVGLDIAMNLKNTLPLGLKLNLVALDEHGNRIEGINISSIELPAGDGSAFESNTAKDNPVEFSIECASPSILSTLDKIAFSIDVESGNGDNALSGKQGLQISNIVLQVWCDAGIDLSK